MKALRCFALVQTSLATIAIATSASAQADPQAAAPAAASAVPAAAGVPLTATSAAAPMAASATTLPASGAQEIVVTGFRASVASAINAKRAAVGEIDVIKAEDIAQFPDNNLAESIQRVPGVSIARDEGEGRSISVRGLGSAFTRTRINGMEAQATTGGDSLSISGNANLGRGFDFNVFASELFNSITVRKTQQAEVDEGSLGATVDLQTAHPFDYKKDTTVALSAQGQYNDLRQRVDPRLAGLFSKKFFGGTLGVLLSGAYSQTHRYQEGSNSVGYDTTANNGGYCAPLGVLTSFPAGSSATQCSPGIPRPAATADNLAAYNTVSAGNGTAVHGPRLPRYGRISTDQKRLGLTGSVQWQPSDHTLVTFDALYSKLKETSQENFLDGFSFSRALSNGGKPQTIVRAADVAPDGDLDYGLFDNVDIRSETRLQKYSTTFQQYTINAHQDLTSWWHLDGLLGIATSKYALPVDATATIDRSNSQGYSFDYRNNDRLPAIGYGFDVTDPSNFGFTNNVSEIRLRQLYVKNEYKTAQLNTTFDVTPGFKLKFGGEYKRFSFDSNSVGRTVSSLSVPALPAGKTVADITSLFKGFGRGLNVPAGTPTSWVTPDIGKFEDVFGIFSNTGTFAQSGIDNSQVRGNIRGVIESTQGYFGEASFDANEIGIPLRGDIGLRYVLTDQSSRGYQLIGSSAVLVRDKRHYGNFLPALNLAYSFKPNLILRFAAAKVMSRPDLGSLTPGGSILTTGARSVSQGNPDLEPIKATTIDVAAEWYFRRDSLISVAYFYKKISTYIQSLQQDLPFSALGLPNDLLANSQTIPSDIFTVSRPVNTPGGPLQGVEVNLQSGLPLNFLPDWLNHFGMLANYTHVTSKIDYILSLTTGATTNADLVGLSKNAANATLYYDNGRLSVRGSLAYRSSYLLNVPGLYVGNDVTGVRGLKTIDANISYALTPNIKMTVEGLNLTDAYADQYEDSARNSPLVYTHTGRQIDFGVQVKF